MRNFQRILSNWGTILGGVCAKKVRKFAAARRAGISTRGRAWGRRGIVARLAATLAFLSLPPALADELPSHHGHISVEAAWITAAEKGGYSVLHFRLVNDGRHLAHLLDINTTVADKARILARVSDHKSVVVNSLSVPADQELDLTSDHLWIKIGPLRQAVRPGQMINVKLIFLRGHLDIEAHVHSVAG